MYRELKTEKISFLFCSFFCFFSPFFKGPEAGVEVGLGAEAGRETESGSEPEGAPPEAEAEAEEEKGMCTVPFSFPNIYILYLKMFLCSLLHVLRRLWISMKISFRCILVLLKF